MEELNICPSSLAEGFRTYSPAAVKLLFDGIPVSHVLPFSSPNNEDAEKELINRSFLSDKLKKYYWQSYNYRRITIK